MALNMLRTNYRKCQKIVWWTETKENVSNGTHVFTFSIQASNWFGDSDLTKARALIFLKSLHNTGPATIRTSVQGDYIYLSFYWPTASLGSLGATVSLPFYVMLLIGSR